MDALRQPEHTSNDWIPTVNSHDASLRPLHFVEGAEENLLCCGEWLTWPGLPECGFQGVRDDSRHARQVRREERHKAVPIARYNGPTTQCARVPRRRRPATIITTTRPQVRSERKPPRQRPSPRAWIRSTTPRAARSRTNRDLTPPIAREPAAIHGAAVGADCHSHHPPNPTSADPTVTHISHASISCVRAAAAGL